MERISRSQSKTQWLNCSGSEDLAPEGIEVLPQPWLLGSPMHRKGYNFDQEPSELSTRIFEADEADRNVMASAGLQLLALVLALCGVFGVLAATLLPNWKVNVDAGSNIITAIVQLQGLWMDCTWYSTGMFSCALKPSILSLPAHVQAARATMVLACVLSALGTCTATVGMECTRLGGDTKTKSHASFAGGLCLVSAGVSGFIPMVWYTKEIIANFLDLTVPESNKHEPGGAVYIGFISAMLLFTSGMIFCTSCIKKNAEAWLHPPKQQPIPTTKPESNSAYTLKDYV